MEDEQAIQDVSAHFRLWLRAGLTGCMFAQQLASKAARTAITVHRESTSPPPGWLNDAFDASARAGRAATAVFPRVANEHDLVELLNTLQSDARWRIKRRAKTSPSGGVLVGLEWTTQHGEISEAMGFAPFAGMPVPRRGPYVAISTWPGSRENPFRGHGPTPSGRPGEVSFLDAPHGLTVEDYEARWAKTMMTVASLMAMPPDDARLYRRAAFVITPEHAAGLRAGE